MSRSRTARLALAALAAAGVAAAPAAAGGEAARDAHGGFTGDLKPVLWVGDVEGSAPFYRDTLGFELVGFAGKADDPYYAELAAAGRTLGLHEPTTPAERERVGRQRLYVRVRDLEIHRARVAARGGSPGPVVTTGYMDFFVVRDPDGNEIAFGVTDPRAPPGRPVEGRSAGRSSTIIRAGPSGVVIGPRSRKPAFS